MTCLCFEHLVWDAAAMLWSNTELPVLLNDQTMYRLDGRHVVFGKVISGMDVVYKVEAEGRQNGTPKSKVVVADSGELPL